MAPSAQFDLSLRHLQFYVSFDYGSAAFSNHMKRRGRHQTRPSAFFHIEQQSSVHLQQPRGGQALDRVGPCGSSRGRINVALSPGSAR